MIERDNLGRRENIAAMRAPGYGRDDFMSSMTDAVRENPVSAALIGMGALWLFSGGGNMPLFGGRRGQTSVAGAMAQGAGTLAHGASDMAQSAASSVGRMGSSIASGVSSTAGGFAEQVSEGAGRIGDYVSSAFHGADAQSEYRNPNFSRAGDGVIRDTMNGMTSGLKDMFDRHPVALGVAGLALGAAVAASLPLTATERDAMGKASETVRDKLGDVAGQAKDIASAAADEVLSEPGFSRV